MNLPIVELPRPAVKLNQGKYTAVVDSAGNVIALFAIDGDAKDYSCRPSRDFSRLVRVEVTE